MAGNVQFDIITFSSGVSSWKGQLVSGQQHNLDAASSFVSSLSAGGGTNINGALEHAFQYKGIEAIYLLTDGMPSEGKATSPGAIRQNILGWNQNIGLSLNTVALLSGGGSGKSGPRKFMYELALQN